MPAEQRSFVESTGQSNFRYAQIRLRKHPCRLMKPKACQIFLGRLAGLQSENTVQIGAVNPYITCNFLYADFVSEVVMDKIQRPFYIFLCRHSASGSSRYHAGKTEIQSAEQHIAVEIGRIRKIRQPFHFLRQKSAAAVLIDQIAVS